KPQAAANNRKPGAVRTGGWGFAPGNDTMPDCDDTGVVLAALAMLDGRDGRDGPDSRDDVSAAIARGASWLLDMQNPDGGWSAYVWGLAGKRPGPAMTRPLRFDRRAPLEALANLVGPHPLLGDPSTEDVTGRVLHGLGAAGLRADHPAVRRALVFLERQQCPNGAFWGRWLLNYLAGTSSVLLGLASVRADLDAPWVLAARAWLLSRQNADGSWGEGPASYADPSQAGLGPGSAPLTGLVVTALLAIGLGATRAVDDGVRYLLSRQRADGTWPDDDFLAPVFPPLTFYAHTEAARYFPLEALGRRLATLAPRSTTAPRRAASSSLGPGNPTGHGQSIS
ncbi:MAG TPA: prenyltransferase/squalene oxidase repeat-containing protein, partial [Kofleriaceae bacterium]|nr:prenyltransferase/squalene oxidase repeat-containing protein [Kofleriaceae bacterium]